MSDGRVGGWRLCMKSPYAWKGKGRSVRTEVGRDRWCKRENRNSFVAGEKPL